MSSPLDSRIRSIAREEAGALLGVPGGVQAGAGPAPTAEQLQEQITDLHEHLHLVATKLSSAEERLAALEKAATQSDTARRTARKTTG